MFSSRAAQKAASMVGSKRMASSRPLRNGVFREKTFKEAWLSDKGAYPCMATFVFGIGFCSSYGFYYMASSPDVRLVPFSSRSRMFRGDLANEYLKEEVDVCK